jgi:hypothetical protein
MTEHLLQVVLAMVVPDAYRARSLDLLAASYSLRALNCISLPCRCAAELKTSACFCETEKCAVFDYCSNGS